MSALEAEVAFILSICCRCNKRKVALAVCRFDSMSLGSVAVAS